METQIVEVEFLEIKFDPKIYPRSKHDPKLVQRYAADLQSIEAARNFISVTADMRLLDGRHRQLAYETVLGSGKGKKINVVQYDVTDDCEAFDLAAKLNSASSWQMTDDDKKLAARKMYARAVRKPQAEIAQVLSVGLKKVSGWRP